MLCIAVVVQGIYLIHELIRGDDYSNFHSNSTFVEVNGESLLMRAYRMSAHNKNVFESDFDSDSHEHH